MHPRPLLVALLLAATAAAPAQATLAFGVWTSGPDATNEAFGDTLTTPGWAAALRAGGQATYYDTSGRGSIGSPVLPIAPNGSASVQPAFADPCPGAVLCNSPAPVRAYGDISGQTGRFRGYATAEASLLNEHYAAYAGGTLLDTLSVAGGGLTLKLSLESAGTHLANPVDQFAASSFFYSLLFTADNSVPGCGNGEGADPCTLDVARFVFISGFDYLAGANAWGWEFDDFKGGFQTDGGFGSLVDLTFELPDLPPLIDVALNASVQASCKSTANGDCRATMDAFNSAYLSLAGNYTSANGFQYLGRTAIAGNGGGNGDPGNAVPEPSSLGLLLAGLAVMGGVVRQRRDHGSSAASARLH